MAFCACFTTLTGEHYRHLAGNFILFSDMKITSQKSNSLLGIKQARLFDPQPTKSTITNRNISIVDDRFVNATIYVRKRTVTNPNATYPCIFLDAQGIHHEYIFRRYAANPVLRIGCNSRLGCTCSCSLPLHPTQRFTLVTRSLGRGGHIFYVIWLCTYAQLQ